MDILKQIKEALYKIRRKPKCIVEKPKPVKKPKPAKPTKPKRKVQTVIIEGKELPLKEVAKKYGIDEATVRARYRAGNRGKLLIRPTPKAKREREIDELLQTKGITANKKPT
jgi:hypothetical protein